MQSVTDKEAWNLFRIAALSEAASWLLLLAGMYLKYVVKPGQETLVAVGGSLHGVIFLGYLVAVVGLWRILRLSLWQGFIALLASVLPLGTLAFERWLARRRSLEANGSYRQIAARGVIANGHGSLLAIQCKDVSFWCLPGGTLLAGESAEQSLRRTVLEQTGIRPNVGNLAYVSEYSKRSADRLELFFTVTNAERFINVPFANPDTLGAEVDRVSYVKLESTSDLRPQFLQETQEQNGASLFHPSD